MKKYTLMLAALLTLSDSLFAEDNLLDLLGTARVDASGKSVQFQSKRLTGVYFSAHWCPPCRAFTPVLVETYKEAQKQGLDFDIVFVSSDNSKKEMLAYMEETRMAWLAVPYNSAESKAAKEYKRDILGSGFIPFFVILDADGEVITTDGRDDVMARGVKAIEKWEDEAPKPLEKYRSFHTVDDVEIVASPIDFDPSSEQIDFELGDGSRRKVAISSLVEPDQEHIRVWHSIDSSLKKLRLTHEEVVSQKQLYSGELSSWASMFPKLQYDESWQTTDSGTAYEDLSYHILVQNRAKQDLQDIRIEYCVFHESTILEKQYEPIPKDGESDDHLKELPPRTVIHTSCGKSSIKNLGEGENRTVETTPIRVFKRAVELKSPDEYHTEPGELGSRKLTNKLIGIRYRILIPIQSGNISTLELADPKSLLETTQWPEASQ